MLTDIHERVLEVISYIVGDTTAQTGGDSSLHSAEEIFTRGNCGNLAAVLSLMFPFGDIIHFPDELHVAFSINGLVYDATGQLFEYDSENVEVVDVSWLHNNGYINNYSASLRGPLS